MTKVELPINQTVDLPINLQETDAPLYVQIAEALLEKIEEGILAPGVRLPPERELSKLLGVNRMTLRQALRALEAEGFFSRRQGRSTFVTEPKVKHKMGDLLPFIDRRGHSVTTKVITLEQQPVDASIAEKLQLPGSAVVYYGSRLHSLNQQPMIVERLFLPRDYFPEFEKYDIGSRSYHEIMETEYGVIASLARQSLESVNATDDEAELLGIPPGSSLMVNRLLTFDQNGRPIEYARDLYRGGRFRFTTDLTTLSLPAWSYK